MARILLTLPLIALLAACAAPPNLDTSEAAISPTTVFQSWEEFYEAFSARGRFLEDFATYLKVQDDALDNLAFVMNFDSSFGLSAAQFKKAMLGLTQIGAADSRLHPLNGTASWIFKNRPLFLQRAADSGLTRREAEAAFNRFAVVRLLDTTFPRMDPPSDWSSGGPEVFGNQTRAGWVLEQIFGKQTAHSDPNLSALTRVYSDVIPTPSGGRSLLTAFWWNVDGIENAPAMNAEQAMMQALAPPNLLPILWDPVEQAGGGLRGELALFLDNMSRNPTMLPWTKVRVDTWADKLFGPVLKAARLAEQNYPEAASMPEFRNRVFQIELSRWLLRRAHLWRDAFGTFKGIKLPNGMSPFMTSLSMKDLYGPKFLNYIQKNYTKLEAEFLATGETSDATDPNWIALEDLDTTGAAFVDQADATDDGSDAVASADAPNDDIDAADVANLPSLPNDGAAYHVCRDDGSCADGLSCTAALCVPSNGSSVAADDPCTDNDTCAPENG